MAYYHYYSYPVLHELMNTYDTYLAPRTYVGSLQEGIVQVTEKTLLLLAESGSESTWKLTDEIRNADDIASFDMDSLSEGMASLKADFNMAMGGALLNFDMTRKEFKDALSKLIALFQKSRKTEAENRLRNALKAYRDGCKAVSNSEFIKEALSNFQGVIDKYRESPLAYLHMGHIYHYQERHRNLRKALDNYTLCYTFAAADAEQAAIAAQGCFYAGWLSAAAFGNMQSGIELTKNALDFDPTLGEAHYNLAKFYGAFGDAKEAIVHLRQAIESFDRKYCLKIEADDDFKIIKDETRRLLYEIAEKDLAEQEEWLRAKAGALSELMKVHAQDRLANAQRMLDTNDYPQIVQTIMLIEKLKATLGQNANKTLLTVKEKEQQRIQEEQQRKAEEEAIKAAEKEARMKEKLTALIEAEMKERIAAEKIKAKKKKFFRDLLVDLSVILLALMLGSFFIYGLSIVSFVLLLILSMLILAWALI